MRQASEWIVPVTPTPIEPDRTAPVDREMDDMQSLPSQSARTAVLLNFTNRPDTTRTGPESDAREALTERGLECCPPISSGSTCTPSHSAAPSR